MVLFATPPQNDLIGRLVEKASQPNYGASHVVIGPVFIG